MIAPQMFHNLSGLKTEDKFLLHHMLHQFITNQNQRKQRELQMSINGTDIPVPKIDKSKKNNSKDQKEERHMMSHSEITEDHIEILLTRLISLTTSDTQMLQLIKCLLVMPELLNMDQAQVTENPLCKMIYHKAVIQENLLERLMT